MADNVLKIVAMPDAWTPAQATERIRRIASEDDFSLTLTLHAEDRMEERGLTIVDVMYVLQNGFVYENPERSTRLGYYKYAVLSPTPNSNRREVKLIVIPSQAAAAKVVTVMWADEVSG